TFPSVQTVMRANLGWTGFGFSADMFINFTSGYRNWSNTSVAPIVTDANGNPVSGGDKVNSNTTIDAHLAYNFSEGWLAGDQIYLDGKNVFDKAPPFYSG